MLVTSIKLHNFRCYSGFDLSFSDKINILIGLNASGKTTVLEAICCIGLTKSFRSTNLRDLVLFNEESLLISAKVQKSNQINTLSLYLDKNGRKVSKNGNCYNKLSDYIGELNVVVFSAIDFLVLNKSPNDRRLLFDPIFCQISKNYIEVCNYYKKDLKERNTLLKRLIIENSNNLQVLLQVVTDRLVSNGMKIIEYRHSFVNKINEILGLIHKRISGTDEELLVEYVPSTSKEEYVGKLNSALFDDKMAGHTSVGPHRDDYIFIINNKNIALFASQGQQRNVMLSLRIAMAALIKQITSESPVLLLDDVFSELDKTRQNALLKNIDKEYQTIITTTSLKELDADVISKANVIQIDKRSE